MDVNWIITAILGIVVIYFFYYVITKKLNYWKDRGVPEIKSKSMTSLFFGKKSFNDIVIEDYEAMEGKKFAAYTPLFRKTVLVRDQELINHILIKDFTYFEDRNDPSEGQGMVDEGITVLTGEKWRYLRHRLTPTFTSGKLKMMFDSMKECCDELVLYVKDKTGEDIEGKRLMFKCILNMIGSVAFGIKINALTDDEESVEFLKLSDKFFKPSAFRFVKFMLFSFIPNWVLKTFKIRLIDSEIDNFFRSLVKDIIAQRERTGTRRNDFLQLMLDQKKRESENSQQDKKNNQIHENESDELEPGDKVLLDQLKFMGSGKENEYKYKNMLNEDCIAAQTFIFISGGSETIAAALSFVLYDLAVHSDLQRKVQDEIDHVLSKEKFSYQAVKNMTYMDRFIQESMRLFPIPALLRMCTKDYKIPGTDVILEKGTFITIPVAGLHNDPQYFPEPKKFDPDRFENADALPKGVYFPFGSGPRMCIAMRLAFLQMKIILATLLSTYNITLSKKTKLPLTIQKMSTVIAAEGGIWLKFEERTKTK